VGAADECGDNLAGATRRQLCRVCGKAGANERRRGACVCCVVGDSSLRSEAGRLPEVANDRDCTIDAGGEILPARRHTLGLA
jgi:hypothetical protein